MKKPQPTFQDIACAAVLRGAVSFSATSRGLQQQHFVINTVLPTIADTMQRVRSQGPKTPEGDEGPPHPPAPEWADNSGEGAASALESLRKLEQSRRTDRPSEDRPGAE